MWWTLHIGVEMVNLRMFKFLSNRVAWRLNEYHESYSEDHDGFHIPTSFWSILMTRVCLFLFHACSLVFWLQRNQGKHSGKT